MLVQFFHIPKTLISLLFSAFALSKIDTIDLDFSAKLYNNINPNMSDFQLFNNDQIMDEPTYLNCSRWNNTCIIVPKILTSLDWMDAIFIFAIVTFLILIVAVVCKYVRHFHEAIYKKNCRSSINIRNCNLIRQVFPIFGTIHLMKSFIIYLKEFYNYQQSLSQIVV